MGGQAVSCRGVVGGRRLLLRCISEAAAKSEAPPHRQLWAVVILKFNVNGLIMVFLATDIGGGGGLDNCTSVKEFICYIIPRQTWGEYSEAVGRQTIVKSHLWLVVCR